MEDDIEELLPQNEVGDKFVKFCQQSHRRQDEKGRAAREDDAQGEDAVRSPSLNSAPEDDPDSQSQFDIKELGGINLFSYCRRQNHLQTIVEENSRIMSRGNFPSESLLASQIFQVQSPTRGRSQRVLDVQDDDQVQSARQIDKIVDQSEVSRMGESGVLSESHSVIEKQLQRMSGELKNMLNSQSSHFRAGRGSSQAETHYASVESFGEHRNSASASGGIGSNFNISSTLNNEREGAQIMTSLSLVDVADNVPGGKRASDLFAFTNNGTRLAESGTIARIASVRDDSYAITNDETDVVEDDDEEENDTRFQRTIHHLDVVACKKVLAPPPPPPPPPRSPLQGTEMDECAQRKSPMCMQILKHNLTLRKYTEEFE